MITQRKRGEGEAEDQIFLSARQSRNRASGSGYGFKLLCSFRGELLTAVYFNRERCRLLVGGWDGWQGRRGPTCGRNPRIKWAEWRGVGMRIYAATTSVFLLYNIFVIFIHSSF